MSGFFVQEAQDNIHCVIFWNQLNTSISKIIITFCSYINNKQRWQRPYLSHTYPYPYMCEVRKISHLAPFAPLRYGTCARCRTFYRTFRTSQKVQKRCERYASAPRTSLGTYAGTKAYLSHLCTSRTFRTWGAAPLAPFAPYELTKNYAFSASVNHPIITFNLFKLSSHRLFVLWYSYYYHYYYMIKLNTHQAF